MSQGQKLFKFKIMKTFTSLRILFLSIFISSFFLYEPLESAENNLSLKIDNGSRVMVYDIHGKKYFDLIGTDIRVE